MGCDIHTFLEIYDDESKVWKQLPTANPVWRDRSYWTFALLAGVRASWFPAFLKPRGLPQNISDIVEKEYKKWAGDAHSLSYYLISELKEYIKQNVKFDVYIDPKDKDIFYFNDEKFRFNYKQWDVYENPTNNLIYKIQCIVPATKILNNDFVNLINNICNSFPDHMLDKIRLVFWFDN